MPVQTTPEEIENFIDAAHNDKYAELELSHGDILITDVTDGGFFPYVNSPSYNDSTVQKIDDELYEIFPFAEVRHIDKEGGKFGHFFHIDMDMPEK
jgi:hypothetical protein